MNLLKLQDQLKGVPDNNLVNLVQQPTGQMPQFLVLAEIQRRKDMRESAQPAPNSTVAEDLEQQGLAALQPPPQEEAPMEAAPEQMDAGLAALPTDMPEAPSMAGGGIVAFAKGDLVGDAANFRLSDPQDSFFAPIGSPEYNKNLQNLFNLARAKTPWITFDEFVKKLNAKSVAPTLSPVEQLNKDTLPRQDIKPFDYNPSPKKTGYIPADSVAPPVPDAGIGAGRIPATGIKAVEWSDIPSTDVAYDQLQKPVRSIEEAKTEWEQAVGQDEGLATLKDKLAGMEAKAAGEEEQAPWMALMRAGLGMAAGTSPFALTNIAAGGIEGVKDYAAAKERLDAKQEKRFEIESRISQAERAEKVAAAKFGVESKQADEKREDLRQLEKLKSKADIDVKNAAGKFDASKANMMKDVDMAQLAETARYHKDSIAAENARTNVMRQSGAETKQQAQATNLLKQIITPMVQQLKASNAALTDEEAYNSVYPKALARLPKNMRDALGYDEAAINAMTIPSSKATTPESKSTLRSILFG